MIILMVSINFYPSVGGIELVTENLAREFVRQGNSVTVVTNTRFDGVDDYPFKVLRKPSPCVLLKEYLKCDIYVHQAISLKYVWPLFLYKKPFCIVYHQVGWGNGFLSFIKRQFARIAYNICVSKTTADGYKLNKCDIIYNAYDDSIFYNNNQQVRRDFVFVGRLNTDKGVYLLIDAFNQFKHKTTSDYKLFIIGDSDERDAIETFAKNTPFSKDIIFQGRMKPDDIRWQLVKRHIMVVPSKRPYREAFGIVVLEGLACGCRVIGSDGDGIEEALHGHGITFTNGDVKELCEAMLRAYESTPVGDCALAEWLDSRKLPNVAKMYIKSFENAIKKS